jgi:D-alanyl-D-alanine carboxypeptidase
VAYQNGRLPASALAPILAGQLAKDGYVAASWNAMNVEARRLGVELRPTGSRSSYRTYADQEYFWNEYQAGRGNLAARPGTSNHGMGLAVDVATQQMRQMIDRIGRKYGWAKEWSDAPSEWWHLRHRAGVWSGPDPGPTGGGAPAPPIPELPEGVVPMAIFVATMSDGRFEVFVEGQPAKAGEAGQVWHAWQAKAGGWAGGEPGKRIAKWESLGTPGK